MENHKKICQVLMQKTESQKVAESFGLDTGYAQLVVALYDDQTWNYIAAYGTRSYERHNHGKEPHLAMMLKGKTMSEARTIIEEFFKNMNITGKIMNLEEP